MIKNNGQVQHNFALTGIRAGAIIGPGATETWAVQLTAGSKNYTCDVPFHDSFGMNGSNDRHLSWSLVPGGAADPPRPERLGGSSAS